MRLVISRVKKYKKISKFVEEIHNIDRSIAKKFMEALPDPILSIYKAEKENSDEHRKLLKLFNN